MHAPYLHFGLISFGCTVYGLLTLCIVCVDDNAKPGISYPFYRRRFDIALAIMITPIRLT